MIKKIGTAILVFILLVFLVSAIDWSPQGNINLKNRYNITNLAMDNCSSGYLVSGITQDGRWVCITI